MTEWTKAAYTLSVMVSIRCQLFCSGVGKDRCGGRLLSLMPDPAQDYLWNCWLHMHLCELNSDPNTLCPVVVWLLRSSVWVSCGSQIGGGNKFIQHQMKRLVSIDQKGRNPATTYAFWMLLYYSSYYTILFLLFLFLFYSNRLHLALPQNWHPHMYLD